MATKLVKVAASGKIADPGVWMKSVVLAAGSAAGSVVIDDSVDGSGTEVLKLTAAADDVGEVWVSGDPQGVRMTNGIYATLAGAGVEVSVEFEA